MMFQSMDMATYKHAGEVVLRRVGQEALLVPVRNKVGDLDSIFTLNETAIAVWESIDGKTSVDDVVERLCREYDVTREQAAADAADIVRALVEARLLQEVD
jgi:Coenzyme PQQ synthesis protein D (PqqD)